MRYLYVLTSVPSDIYYEQLLLSLTSLSLSLPGAEVVLLCDSKTKETLAGARSDYRRFVSETIAVDVPPGLNQQGTSRWVKTSMRRAVPGDFLFLDCDTIVAGDISAVEKTDIIFGACLDKHSRLNRHHMKEYIAANDKKLGFSSHLSDRHFNSGVIYCRDIPETRKLFDRWRELWLFSNSKNISIDQPSFNQAVYENSSILAELDGTWNCQIAYNGLPFLADSKIIHYFASSLNSLAPPYVLASVSLLKKIKETGKIPDEALELLKNPRTAFDPESRIVTGKEMEVVNSFIFSKLLWLKNNKPGFFDKLNKLSSHITKPKRKQRKNANGGKSEN